MDARSLGVPVWLLFRSTSSFDDGEEGLWRFQAYTPGFLARRLEAIQPGGVGGIERHAYLA